MNLKKILVAAIVLASAVGATPGEAQAQRRPSFADRPLNTKKRLYVRKSGTRVYSDPRPPRRRVWRYRRADGRVVTKVTGDKSAATKRPARRRITRRAR